MARNVVIESYCYACMAFIIKASNVSLAKRQNTDLCFLEHDDNT